METIHRYENGQEHIGASRLWLVGDKLGVSVHYFFMDAMKERTAEVIPFPDRKGAS